MDWKQTQLGFASYLLTKNCGQATVRIYTNNVSLFNRWCARYEITAWDATKTLVRNYLGERLASGISNGRVYNDLMALRRFYSWGVEDGIQSVNPTDGLSIKRSQQLPTKPFLDGEATQLLQAAANERDRLILLVMISTGMRVAEVANLTSDCIDWERGELKFIGKGNKERRVAPRPEVLGRLRAFLGMFHEGPLWRGLRSPHEPLSYNQIRYIVYHTAQLAGLEGIHPHRFRATFATWFLEETTDIQALQDILGHASVSTSARYTEWTKQKRALKLMSSLNSLERLIS